MQRQANARLARRYASAHPVLVGEARVDQHLAEHDALRGEYLYQQFVWSVEARLRKTIGAQSILVTDHHEFVARIAQAQQCRYHTIDQAQLLVGIDLEIVWFDDQCAVAIDEQDLSAAHAAHSTDCASTASNLAFSSGLPTVIRSASSSPG